MSNRKSKSKNQSAGALSYKKTRFQDRYCYQLKKESDRLISANRLCLDTDEILILEIFSNFVLPNLKIDDKYLTYSAYDTLTAIGAGSFGFTSSFKDGSDITYVLKILHFKLMQTSQSRQYAIRELENMVYIGGYNNIDKPSSILNTYGVFYLDQDNRIGQWPHGEQPLIPDNNIQMLKYLKKIEISGTITESADFDLEENTYLSRLKPKEKLLLLGDYIVEFNRALKYLIVSKGGIHLDIKPENLMIKILEPSKLITHENVQPKLIDFGLFTKVGNIKIPGTRNRNFSHPNATRYSNDKSGSPYFMAPERSGNTTQYYASNLSDVYELMVSLLLHFSVVSNSTLQYLNQEPLLQLNDRRQLEKFVAKYHLIFGYTKYDQNYKNISDTLLAIIIASIRRSPRNRLDSLQILHYFNHIYNYSPLDIAPELKNIIFPVTASFNPPQTDERSVSPTIRRRRRRVPPQVFESESESETDRPEIVVEELDNDSPVYVVPRRRKRYRRHPIALAEKAKKD